MIPTNITREHVLRAIDEIKYSGIPNDRHSVKWSVSFEGINYPPKYLISTANIYANGEEWSHLKFSGGDESNRFLENLEFEIIKSSSKGSDFPYVAHSWTIISKSVAIKKLDKSSFLHRGTAIPFQLKSFFDVENLKKGQKVDIALKYRSSMFKAHFQLDPKLMRVRLFWRADFSRLLKSNFSGWYEIFSNDIVSEKVPPSMRLLKLPHDAYTYEIEFINPLDIELDVDSELSEESEPRHEGAVREYYGKRYERDPLNRKRAIEIHGTNCTICGFDFESFYGERGRGFIEVHHVTPIASFDHEIEIDPKTDLLPVCSNCHRMIHRRKEYVLSIDEVKHLIHMKNKQPTG
jgi:5-methylcytosine-specific restriction protein A